MKGQSIQKQVQCHTLYFLYNINVNAIYIKLQLTDLIVQFFYLEEKPGILIQKTGIPVLIRRL